MLYDPFTALKSDASGGAKAGKMAATSANSFGKFNLALFKGVTVDMPLTTTEGFRNLPKLYGEEVKDHGEVTGIASGFAVAGKNFAHGMIDLSLSLYLVTIFYIFIMVLGSRCTEHPTPVPIAAQSKQVP